MESDSKEKNGAPSLSDVARVIKDVICLLVDDKESVEVRELPGSNRTLIEVSVNRQNRDHGKLVGKAGRNVNALKGILLSVSGKREHTWELDLLDGYREARAEKEFENRKSGGVARR